MTSDSLRCLYPLPLPEFQNRYFETLDLVGNNLSFVISSSGELFRESYRLEDDNTIIYGMTGENYHGELVFCCLHEEEVIAFAADFWEGQLTKIEVLEID